MIYFSKQDLPFNCGYLLELMKSTKFNRELRVSFRFWAGTRMNLQRKLWCKRKTCDKKNFSRKVFENQIEITFGMKL